ncbi:MAG: DUF177 domain-containing protein [Armatimonadetes bacterium]|nr:DUF177 domain-containing protein [Armatimonadota bacterium]
MSTIVHLDQGRPILDLDELIRQWIVCGLPLRTLCSEECAGLCSTCGVNLNDGRCRCEAQQASSPFAALASLLETDPNRPAD